MRRLTGAISASQASVEWAGQSVAEDGTIAGRLDVEEVHDGLVSLFASEAVIVEIC